MPVSREEALVHDWVGDVRGRRVHWTSLRIDHILASGDLDDDNADEQG